MNQDNGRYTSGAPRRNTLQQRWKTAQFTRYALERSSQSGRPVWARQLGQRRTAGSCDMKRQQTAQSERIQLLSIALAASYPV
jgi:hypothetical protein